MSGKTRASWAAVLYTIILIAGLNLINEVLFNEIGTVDSKTKTVTFPICPSGKVEESLSHPPDLNEVGEKRLSTTIESICDLAKNEVINVNVVMTFDRGTLIVTAWTGKWSAVKRIKTVLGDLVTNIVVYDGAVNYTVSPFSSPKFVPRVFTSIFVIALALALIIKWAEDND